MQSIQSPTFNFARFYMKHDLGKIFCLAPVVIGLAQLVVFFTGVISDSFHLGIAIAFLCIGYFLFVIRGFQKELSHMAAGKSSKH